MICLSRVLSRWGRKRPQTPGSCGALVLVFMAGCATAAGGPPPPDGGSGGTGGMTATTTGSTGGSGGAPFDAGPPIDAGACAPFVEVYPRACLACLAASCCDVAVACFAVPDCFGAASCEQNCPRRTAAATLPRLLRGELPHGRAGVRGDDGVPARELRGGVRTVKALSSGERGGHVRTGGSVRTIPGRRTSVRRILDTPFTLHPVLLGTACSKWSHDRSH